MRLKNDIQIHEVAGERIAMLHNADQMTRVISFNESALYLWNALKNNDFELGDVVSLLLDKYDVKEKTAKNDALVWVTFLKENDLLA